MAVLGNEEHKQRVNLSSLAASVMEMDRSALGRDGSLSGFINRIITAYWDRADASIDTAAAERCQQLLSDGYPADVAQRLAEEYSCRLKEQMEAYPQGDSMMFRLNNHNFDLLYEQRVESAAYASPGKYLKALLEEYARLSPSERERVYYRSLIEDTLQPAIDGGYCLEIRLKKLWFWFRPHSVMADPFNSHLYLVGMMRRVDKPAEEETIASFRVTRIAEVKPRRHSGGRITADERRQIEKRLQQVGVQYLIGEQDAIVLRLTDRGRRDFSQRSYMRPMPRKIEGDLYHFNCSPMQVRNYFLSFGENVEVLEPESLRQEFAEFYCAAANLYDKNPV